MDNEKMLVSVVVPMYNASKYLNECMDTILRQSHENLQIICVDDGSTDSTREIVESYQTKDSRVEYLHQKHQTAGKARNNGLRHAKGKYVIFLDADDFFSEDMIETLCNKADSENADIVICGSLQYDDETQEYGELNHSLDMEIVPGNVFSCRDIPDSIFQLTAGWAWDKLYRTEFVKEKKILFQDIKIANDELFVDVAYAEAERIAVVDKKMVFHRTHVKTSIEFNRADFWESGIEMLYEEKKELLKRGKFNLLKVSFVNRAARYLIWHSCTLAETNKFDAFYDKVKDYVEFLEILSVPRSSYHDDFYYDELERLIKSSALEYVGHVLKRTNNEKRRGEIDNIRHIRYINELKVLLSKKRWHFSKESVPSGARIIVYGFGDVGRDLVVQIEESKDYSLVAVVDNNWEKVNADNIGVYSPEKIISMKYDYVIVGVFDLDVVDEIYEKLLSYGIPKEKIISRKNKLFL